MSSDELEIEVGGISPSASHPGGARPDADPEPDAKSDPEPDFGGRDAARVGPSAWHHGGSRLAAEPEPAPETDFGGWDAAGALAGDESSATESDATGSIVDGDADAPWRPGYTGPEPRPPTRTHDTADTGTSDTDADGDPATNVDPWSRAAAATPPPVDDAALPPPDPATPPTSTADPTALTDSAGRPPATRLAGPIGLVVVFCVVAAGALALTLSLRNRGGITESVSIPAEVDELWSAELESTDFDPDLDLVGNVVVVVTPSLARGIDVRTGTDRWTAAPRGDNGLLSLGRADDLLLVLERSSDSALARAIDVGTGEQRWSRNLENGRSLVAFEDYLFEFSEPSESAAVAVELLDPMTGRPRSAQFELAPVGVVPPLLAVIDDADDGADGVALLDAASGEIVASGIDPEQIAATAVIDGRSVWVSTDGVITLLGDEGAVLDEIETGLGRRPVNGRLIAIPDTSLGLLPIDDTVIAVEVRDDRLDIGWSMTGALEWFDVEPTARLVAIDSADFDIDRVRIVDPQTGEVRFEIDTLDRDVFGARLRIADNGVVQRDARGLRALDVDGEEIWTLDERFESFVVGDDVVVVRDGSRLTAYG